MHHRFFDRGCRKFYDQTVFALGDVDLDEVATALSDQTDYDYRWLIDPRTAAVVFWSSDTGVDGENPVGIDELDLTVIDPLPPLHLVSGHGRLHSGHQ